MRDRACKLQAVLQAAERAWGREYLLLSWNSSMQRLMSARQAASSSVQESGGKPPLLSPRLMAPLVG